MSDADKRGQEPGMGIVKKRRSRKLLETRDAAETGDVKTGASAAAAWGDHLESQVRDGTDRTPDPVPASPTGGDDDGPGVIESKPGRQVRARKGVSEEDTPTRVRARPKRPPNRRKQDLPDILRDDVVGAPKPKKRDLGEVVDILAHQQKDYEEESQFEGVSAFSLRRNRLWLSLTAVVAALVLAALPVYFEWSYRASGVLLQTVLKQHAGAIATAHPNLATLVSQSEFAALRKIYAEQHPKLVAAVRAAGFEDAQDQNVTIRVDFKAAALVLGVGMEHGEGEPIAAQASTNGKAVGRPLAEASVGAALSEHALNVATLLLLAFVVVLGLYLGPALVEALEGRRARADAERRAAGERAEFEEMTREG